MVAERAADARQQPTGEYSERYWAVTPGQLVVNPMWLIGGGIGVSFVNGAVSPDYRVYKLDNAIYPRYIHHLLRSAPYRDQYKLLIRAETTFDRRITKDDFGGMPIPLPPLPTQRAIANYLDSETSQIDALIAAKRRIVDLLKERRQAVIDRALLAAGTKVPAKHLISRITSGPRGWAQYGADEGVLFLRITNVSASDIELDMTNTMYVNPPEGAERRRTSIYAGDVLVSITAEIGSVGVARTTEAGAAVSQHVALLTPKLCSGDWLAYALCTSDAKAQQEASRYGGTKTQLALEDVANISLPFVSVAEQARVLADLAKIVDTIRTTQRNLALQIRLLREHRQALITAAVTGQLTIPEAV
jgi:type I restriction enzyme S subunit